MTILRSLEVRVWLATTSLSGTLTRYTLPAYPGASPLLPPRYPCGLTRAAFPGLPAVLLSLMPGSTYDLTNERAVVSAFHNQLAFDWVLTGLQCVLDDSPIG